MPFTLLPATDKDSLIHLTEMSERAKEIFAHFNLEKPLKLQETLIKS